ncbi:MAG: class II aldolase/adducin family protein, partial [Eubacteriales bacterium]|nr:class II aldolase/adducin family protein [Eubacteriales bacterium]
QCAQLIGRVGIAPYDVPGGTALGEKIAEVFARGNDCVIMENHGIVLGGNSMQHAFDRLEALNLIFEIYTRSKTFGDLQFCDASHCEFRKEVAVKVPDGPGQYRNEAMELHKFVKRIYQKNLSLSNPDLFCISQRVEDGIITNPSDVPLYQLDEDRYIFVNQQNAYSHHQKVHLEIYKNNPGIQCITSAIAPNIMSFSVTDTAFTTDIIPEAYVVLRSVAILEYRDYWNIGKILDTINITTNEIIFKNNCFLCCGSTPLNMYDRVEVLEYSAKAIIDAKNVGKVIYIEGDAIQDIIKAFHLEE